MSAIERTGQGLAQQAQGFDAIAVPSELLPILHRFCDAATLHGRRIGFVNIIGWMREGGTPALELKRVLSFVELLESDAALRTRVQQSLELLLTEIDSLHLFAESGLPSVHPFTTEILRRISERILPSARRDNDASKLLNDLFSREKYVKRFAELPPDLFRRIASALTPEGDPDFWCRQLRDLQESMRLLAARISGLGLTPEMRERGSLTGIARSPFYEIVRSTEEMMAAADTSESAAGFQSWKQLVARCRQEMEEVYTHMESAGISVELVFDLKTIQACLARMEGIATILAASDTVARLAAVHSLLARLADGNITDKQITSLLQDNLSLLARKIVDRTGDTGEHYIANSKAEYKTMWLAAAGGGLLTVFTAAIKMRIVESNLPPFVEGFAAGTNYAVSFILLQVFGLVLATKQPATTAAAFARIIRDNRGQQRSSKLTDFVARITSTQLAAAIGNVTAVSIGCVVFEWLWRGMFAHPYLPRESATHVYETLHPFHSGTAFYAVVTGIILWLAALAGSWMENAAVYYHFADAVAQHPLGTRLSPALTRKFAWVVRHNLGGWSTSIVLGYLLGFTPEIGRFFGIPLDVRHVTLSSGTLALAAARFGTASLGDRWFAYALEGIGIVFVLNLTVSFTIALIVALRAYDVPWREQFNIMWSVLLGAVRSPLRFIVPQYGTKTEGTALANGEARANEQQTEGP